MRSISNLLIIVDKPHPGLFLRGKAMFNELIISHIQLALAIVCFVIYTIGVRRTHVEWPNHFPVKIPPPYAIITMNLMSLNFLLLILRFVGRWDYIDSYFFAIFMGIVVIILNAYCFSRLLINAYSFILSCDEASISSRKLLKDD